MFGLILPALLACSTAGTERAAHAVTLKAFLLDQHEVTVQEYSRCVQAGNCGAPNGCNWGKPELAQHPVNCVNWHDAAAQTSCEAALA